MEVSRTLVHCPVQSETHSHQKEGRGLGERYEVYICMIYTLCEFVLPCTLSLTESSDGLLLATVHV